MKNQDFKTLQISCFPLEFDSNTESATNPTANEAERLRYNRSAFLICIFEGEDGDLRLILTDRYSTLSTHSCERDVSLPGGKTEKGDANVTDTALRKGMEDRGLGL
ncbi:unnamed protein product [Ilex paraguariensis]|uniref:Nudix hydrolase domain-containing protein n=1 Tax=Ilex paraguariensis TaxID=185542 RepID=A0ABC8T7A6_9AQUA